MPNRYIREGIISSEAVNSLTWQEEVFYRRLQSKVDDYGRYTSSPALLRAALFPLQLEQVREADIPRLLESCERAGLLFVYAACGKQCLVMNKWEKGRAKHSEYPEPPPDVIERMQTYVYTRKHMSAPPTPVPTPIPTVTTTHEPVGCAELPTEQEFVRLCAAFSVPEWYAQNKWAWWDAKQWMHGQTRMNAKGVARLVSQDYQNDGKPLKPIKRNGLNSKPIAASPGNVGTANAGQARKY